jgi:hypothetical protein
MLDEPRETHHSRPYSPCKRPTARKAVCGAPTERSDGAENCTRAFPALACPVRAVDRRGCYGDVAGVSGRRTRVGWTGWTGAARGHPNRRRDGPYPACVSPGARVELDLGLSGLSELNACVSRYSRNHLVTNLRQHGARLIVVDTHLAFLNLSCSERILPTETPASLTRISAKRGERPPPSAPSSPSPSAHVSSSIAPWPCAPLRGTSASRALRFLLIVGAGCRRGR